jgi:uncharacterized protein (TIGR02099 family)
LRDDLKKLLSTFFRIGCYFFAILVVLAAVSVVLARALTPLLNDHIPYFEKWAGDLLNSQIKIGRLEANWQGWHPDLKLKNISVLSKDGKKTQLHINLLQVDISVYHSLFAKSIQPNNIEITGVDLTVSQRKGITITSSSVSGGDFVVSGLPQQRKFKNKTKLYTEYLDWLLSQPRLVLNNIHVNWRLTDGQIFPVELKHLYLSNTDNTHKLSGSVGLMHNPNSNITIALDLLGNIRNRADMKIAGRLNVKNLDLSKFAQNANVYDYKINKGKLAGSFWFQWQDKKFQVVHSILHLKQLNIAHKQQMFAYKQLDGNILWELKKDGWQLTGDHLQVVVNNKKWPEDQFIFSKTRQKDTIKQHLWLHYFNISAVQAFLADASFMPQKFKTAIKGLKPSGEIYNIFFDNIGGEKKPLGEYKLFTQVRNLSFKKHQKIPALNNFSGVVTIEPTSGQIILDADNLKLDFGSLFAQPFLFDHLSGQIDWNKQADQGWMLVAQNVAATNDYMTLSGQGSLLIPRNGKNPFISVLAGFDINDSSKAPLCLPLGILKPNVVKWLNNAFVSGDGGYGTAILNGPLDSFPFDSHNGLFIVDANVRKTNLHYAPGWPDAKNISAKLIFKNRSMYAVAKSGQVYSAKVKTMVAEIPYMGKKHPSVLSLDGQLAGGAGDILRYLKESPLNNSFGEDLKPLKLSGDALVGLNLAIPLHHPEQVKIKGYTEFNNALLDIPSWKLQAKQLNGKVLFTEKKLWSELLQATLFNEPANFTIKTIQTKKDKPFTRVNLRSKARIKSLFNYFNWAQLPYLSGETDYHIIVDLRTAKKDSRQNSLKASSDLYGVNINLPYPFNKTAKQVVPFNMSLKFGAGKTAQAMLYFGKKLSAALTLQPKFKANIHLGSGVAKLQKLPGIYVDGFLQYFDWTEWQKALTANKTKGKQNSAFKKLLREIKIKIGEINLFEQNLHNAIITVTPKPQAWQIGIEHLKILGTILIPENLTTGTVNANFKRLYLGEIKSSKKVGEKANPGSIPALNIHANSFQYGDEFFGVLNLKTHHEKNLFKLDKLTVSAPLISGNITGKWSLLNGDYASNLNGTLNSKDIDKVLKSQKINSSLVVTNGGIGFDLNWPGKIYQPELKKMSGQINVSFGKGWIVDLKEDANVKLNVGRLLTLLSLNRILMMNFADLVHKGYGFDSVKGALNLRNGVISMEHLFFEGSVASIDASGTIDTIAKNLNLFLTIIPHVTSSLPVIATIAGGPIVGAATWVADLVLGKAVDKITSHNYKVTGPWSKPIVKELVK